LDFEAEVIPDAEITPALNAMTVKLQEEEFTWRNLASSAEIVNPPPPSDADTKRDDVQRQIDELGRQIAEALIATTEATKELNEKAMQARMDKRSGQKDVMKLMKEAKVAKKNAVKADAELKEWKVGGNMYYLQVWQRASYQQTGLWSEKFEMLEIKMKQQRDLMKVCTDQNKLVIQFDENEENANQTVIGAVSARREQIEAMKEDFSNGLTKCHTDYAGDVSEFEAKYIIADHAVDAAAQYSKMIAKTVNVMEGNVQFLKERREEAVEIWLDSAMYVCEMEKIYAREARGFLVSDSVVDVGKEAVRLLDVNLEKILIKAVVEKKEHPLQKNDMVLEVKQAQRDLDGKFGYEWNETTNATDTTPDQKKEWSENFNGVYYKGDYDDGEVAKADKEGFKVFKELTEHIIQISRHRTIQKVGEEAAEKMKLWDDSAEELQKVIASLPVKGETMATLMEQLVKTGDDHFVKIKNLYCQFHQAVQDRIKAITALEPGVTDDEDDPESGFFLPGAVVKQADDGFTVDDDGFPIPVETKLNFLNDQANDNYGRNFLTDNYPVGFGKMSCDDYIADYTENKFVCDNCEDPSAQGFEQRITRWSLTEVAEASKCSAEQLTREAETDEMVNEMIMMLDEDGNGKLSSEELSSDSSAKIFNTAIEKICVWIPDEKCAGAKAEINVKKLMTSLEGKSDVGGEFGMSEIKDVLVKLIKKFIEDVFAAVALERKRKEE